MASTQSPPLQQGIELVQKAIEFDNQHKYNEAIQLYDQSVLYLIEATKHETNPGTEMAIQAKIKEYQSRSTTLKSALQQPPAPQLSQPSLLPQSSGYGAGTPTPALMPSGSGYGQINPSMPPQRMGYGGSSPSIYNNPNTALPYGPSMMQPSGGGGFSPGMAMGIGSPYGPYGAPQPQQQPYAPYYMGNPSYTAAGISLSTAGAVMGGGSPYGSGAPYAGGGAGGAYPPPYGAYPQQYAGGAYNPTMQAQAAMSVNNMPMGQPNNSANTLAARPLAMIDSSGKGGAGKRLVQEKSHSSWNPLRPGALHLRAEIASDVVRLGETLSIRVVVTNPSSQKVDCMRVRLNRNDYRFTVGHTGKIPKERICEKEYVQGNRFPMREGSYDGELLFPIPQNISPSTGGNFEYYLTVSCYLGHTSKDLHVRLPIKIVSL